MGFSAGVALSPTSIDEIAQSFRARSAAVDASATFPRDNWADLTEAGLTSLTVPVRYGGTGVGTPQFIGIVRNLGAACPSTGLALLMHSCATAVVGEMGSEALKSTYLPAIARGAIAAYAGTERGTGTNFWALESNAEETSDGYLLQLRKSWATLADVADLFVIPTRVSAVAAPTQISLFLVERREGVFSPEPWLGTGMRGSCSGPVDVNAVVPCERLMGTAGRANDYITTDMFNLLLVSHAALYIGVAEEALGLAADRARRRVFPHTGTALAHESLWLARIGALSADVQAGAVLLQKAAIETGESRGSRRLLRSALASKPYACGLARRATDLAMEIFGGSGYNRGERVELLWRDARAGSLMRPADEVAQIMLGRLECGLDPV
jgi:alkylation response protein AidB-like acyl-CoA dehydrogenase